MSVANCPVCEYVVINTYEEAVCCPRCGAELTEGNKEKKLMEAQGTYTSEDKQFFGKMSTNVTVYLSDRRLVVIPEKMEGFNLTTALTAAVVNKMTNKYGIVSLPLEEIKAVRDGKFGLFVKALVVDASNGELLKLTLPKRKEWKEALIGAAPNLY